MTPTEPPACGKISEIESIIDRLRVMRDDASLPPTSANFQALAGAVVYLCRYASPVADERAETARVIEKQLAEWDAQEAAAFPSAQPSGALEREEVGASVPSRPLEHRWYGSGPNRGDYLYIDRKEVAYLGDQHHTQVSSLVYEVNKLFMERAK